MENEDVKLGFVAERHVLLSPVTAEVYVTRLLNLAEFRVHAIGSKPGPRSSRDAPVLATWPLAAGYEFIIKLRGWW